MGVGAITEGALSGGGGIATEGTHSGGASLSLQNGLREARGLEWLRCAE